MIWATFTEYLNKLIAICVCDYGYKRWLQWLLPDLVEVLIRNALGCQLL